MPRSRTFAANVALTTGANLALAVIALMSGSLAARLLGPGGRGELAAIQTWAALFALAGALGLPDAVVYFSSRDPRHAGRYLATATGLAVLAAIPLGAIGYYALPALLAAQSPGTLAAARWYLILFLFLQATQGMLLHPLRGLGDFTSLNLVRLCNSTGWLAAILLIGLTGHASAGRLAAGYILSLTLTAAPAVFIVARSVAGPFRPRIALCSRMLAYGAPLALTSIPQLLNLRLDQLAMATFMPATQLGYYVAAVAWSGAVAPLLSGVGIVLLPRVASGVSDAARIADIAAVARVGTIPIALVTLLQVAATPLAIPMLFGARFAPAISTAWILSIAGAALAFAMLLEDGARGLGLPGLVLRSELAGLVVTVVCLGILLRPYGIIGAALASLAGYSTIALSVLLSLSRRYQRPLTCFLRPGREDLAALARQSRLVLASSGLVGRVYGKRSQREAPGGEEHHDSGDDTQAR